MLFNSIEYIVFLPIAFGLYWLVFKSNLKAQNLLLVVLSYVFYGYWDWRFLTLIFLSTVVDFIIGKKIYTANKKSSKKWLWTSVLFNIGILGFFKYFNFFVDSFSKMLNIFGYDNQDNLTLNIILPVGISFYTFQTLSYSLDIYRKKLTPTHDFIAFAAFVSFFPQLVAGPIERASRLLPQILHKRSFSYTQAKDGMKLMLWGLFKKIAIADALAPIVDDIFVNYTQLSSPVLIMGAVFFGFQIYCDFSGYSDIAIGTSKMFGIELTSNFKFPYFSRNIAEFWRRWHISLSTWFRDYLYIPLGGSKGEKSNTIRNIFVIFLVSGFWHGANWTFIFWGGFHALLFVPLFLSNKNRVFIEGTVGGNSILPSIKEILQILSTFTLVTISWVFFRASSVNVAFEYLTKLFSSPNFEPYPHPLGYRWLDYFVLLGLFLCYEYFIRRDERNPIPFRSRAIRFLLYVLLVFGMLLMYDDHIDRSFIYFQF
ncbi:MBOAT family O-acyltransferase [Flagellimonas pacifica]|uniref:D-alanyl-lipoteichoic acid acyltransferase DltB, MBOAT superfamily n=1 Tax=Flagellimonas pacifica TaxID=1247520 RepID=A0A285ME29_9FLAO|nr:MBOAT family O-acyltransferase [Allomuricauda parva]SNY95368.1 D-alanyl-lipoteichoic acid acyltransferase DltB, MBOAT superfamily [Allomuricauda parva]